MKKIYQFILLMSFSINLFSQVQLENQQMDLEKLKEQFPNSQVKSPELESAYFAALKSYPEFKEVKVTVKFASINTSMQCRPQLSSLWKAGRRYVILVNKDIKSPKYPLKASFAAQVGCFAHELAHIVKYENQSNREIIVDGLKFITSTPFRSAYEKSTDRITIEKGFGCELYEFSKYVFENPNMSVEYLAFKKEIYYCPADILELYEKVGRQQLSPQKAIPFKFNAQ